MKQDLKQKWVRALRSGDYKQTTGTLYEDNSYCCLGVLCEILVDEGVMQRDTGRAKNSPDWREYFLNADFVSEETMNGYYFGAPAPMDGELDAPTLGLVEMENDAHSHLIDMNDKEGKGFTEIADWIEENL